LKVGKGRQERRRGLVAFFQQKFREELRGGGWVRNNIKNRVSEKRGLKRKREACLASEWVEVAVTSEVFTGSKTRGSAYGFS